MHYLTNAKARLFNLITLAFIACLIAAPVWAAPTVDDIYTAVDFSGMQAKLIPMAVLLVGIALVGVVTTIAIRYMKKGKSAA